MLQLIAVAGLLAGLNHAREVPPTCITFPAQALQPIVLYSQDSLPSQAGEAVSQLPPHQRYVSDSQAVMSSPPRPRMSEDTAKVKRMATHPQPSPPPTGAQHDALPVRLKGHEAVWKTVSN